MIETILTPTALWKNFELPETIGANIVQEQTTKGITFSKLQLEGRSVKDGKVSIYAELMRPSKKEQLPAILLVEGFGVDSNSLVAKDLVKRGYAVLMVDLAGKMQDKENYTVYPQSINYANYEIASQDIYGVKKDAKATCWYEWCATIKYALKYLRDLTYITKVGVFGVSTVATAVWQILGSEQDLGAGVIALNSGWIGYKGIYKFGGMVEPQFTTEMCQFIAGIDSQSYAMHVKAPMLLLSATNDNNFDVDRAQDTMSKIPEQTYSATYLSANYTDRISFSAYSNALVFFDKYLCGAKVNVPNGAEIKCDLVGGKVVLEVQTDEKLVNSVDKVEIFVSEEMIQPQLRCYEKIDVKKSQNGKFTAKYLPYSGSEIIFAYANVYYKNGLKLSTSIVAKRFTVEQVGNSFKNNILYSSRKNNSHSIFSSAMAIKGDKNIETTDSNLVVEKKGPMGINGVTCRGGLLTFALASKKYQPKNGSMLLLDAYVKEPKALTVKLISNYFGEKIEYFVKINLLGGDIWQNIMIEMNKFKTAEGMTLKDYSKIDALEITVDDGEYLINNALWV